jgi:hypothetical protein
MQLEATILFNPKQSMRTFTIQVIVSVVMQKQSSSQNEPRTCFIAYDSKVQTHRRLEGSNQPCTDHMITCINRWIRGRPDVHHVTQRGTCDASQHPSRLDCYPDSLHRSYQSSSVTSLSADKELCLFKTVSAVPTRTEVVFSHVAPSLSSSYFISIADSFFLNPALSYRNLFVLKSSQLSPKLHF